MKLVRALRSGLLRPSDYFTQANPAASATAIKEQFPWAPSGPYWISVPTVGACHLWVDFDYTGMRNYDERVGQNNDNGGPWVCVMTAQNDDIGPSTAWTFGHAAYNSTAHGQTSLVTPWQNRNEKSEAFNYLPTTAIRMDAGNKHKSHWWENYYSGVNTLDDETCLTMVNGATDRYMLRSGTSAVFTNSEYQESIQNGACLNSIHARNKPRMPHMFTTGIPHSVYNNTQGNEMRSWFGRAANDNGRVGFVQPDRGSYGKLMIGVGGDSDSSDNNDWVCGFGAGYSGGGGGPGTVTYSFALLMHENCDAGHFGAVNLRTTGTLWIRN